MHASLIAVLTACVLATKIFQKGVFLVCNKNFLGKNLIFWAVLGPNMRPTPFQRHQAYLEQAWKAMKEQILLKQGKI